MRHTVGVPELEYRIDLPGVPALEVNDCSVCLQRTGSRPLVAVIKQSAGENEARDQSQKTNSSRHGSPRLSGNPRQMSRLTLARREHNVSASDDIFDFRTRLSFEEWYGVDKRVQI